MPNFFVFHTLLQCVPEASVELLSKTRLFPELPKIDCWIAGLFGRGLFFLAYFVRIM